MQETSSADIVIAVKKGTEKTATPVASGGPIDKRPVTLETTDNQIRIGAKQGQDGSYNPDSSPSNGRAQQTVEVGPSEDSFLVYLGGDTFKPNSAFIWSLQRKNNNSNRHNQKLPETASIQTKPCCRKQSGGSSC